MELCSLDGQSSKLLPRRDRELRRESQEPDRRVDESDRSGLERASIEPAEKGVRKLTQAELRELDGLFGEIEAAEARVAELHARLADPEIYQRSGDVVVSLRSDLEGAEAEAARLATRWEELEERKAASKGS